MANDYSKSNTASRSDLVRRLIEAVESNKLDEYVTYFMSDAVYKIGNSEPVIGQQGIKELALSVMGTIESVTHDIKNIWEVDDTVICHVDLTYNRKDGKVVKIPNLNIIQFKGDKIQNYKAFLDAAPVFS